MDQEDKTSRTFFRVEYPPEVQPEIQFDKGNYSVVNLCEGGVKFRFNTRKADMLNLERKTLTATIVFHNHDKTEIIGNIIRFDKDHIVLKLTQGISLQKIMAEQRFLLNKYGTLRRPNES